MKVHILGTPEMLRPTSQPFKYPAHNDDYGVEQDFHRYMLRSALLTDDPSEADWHYLPVFWTRWHLNHDYGKTGIEELQDEVTKAVLDDAKTFVVCQYDDGPKVSLGRSTRFLASRRGADGIDIPLLCRPHRRPWLPVRKKHRASFVGRISTHPAREKMRAALGDLRGAYIVDADRGVRYYVRTMLASLVALCPRGYGGSSFRFFEAMELGVAPLLISDRDVRPFRRFIDWDRMSLFSTPERECILKAVQSRADEELLAMGENARVFYAEHLGYGKWCDYVMRELERLR